MYLLVNDKIYEVYMLCNKRQKKMLEVRAYTEMRGTLKYYFA